MTSDAIRCRRTGRGIAMMRGGGQCLCPTFDHCCLQDEPVADPVAAKAMTQSGEVIKTYAGSDVGACQYLVTLEDFISEMDNAELADDSTVDTSDAVTAINGLILSLEQRDAEIERLRAFLQDSLHSMERGGFNRPLQERLRKALENYAPQEPKP